MLFVRPSELNIKSLEELLKELGFYFLFPVKAITIYDETNKVTAIQDAPGKLKLIDRLLTYEQLCSGKFDDELDKGIMFKTTIATKAL
jgi:hypothetical protein